MAAEVDAGKYLFLKSDGGDHQSSTTRKKWKAGEEYEDPADVNASFLTVDQALDIFRHNTLHDMESVWWLSLEFVINNERTLAATAASSSDTATIMTGTASDVTQTMAESEDTSDDQVDPTFVDSAGRDTLLSGTRSRTDDSIPTTDAVGLTDADRRYARSVFYGFPERVIVMAGGGQSLQSILYNLPSSIRFIGDHLFKLRGALVAQYENIEANGPPNTANACPPRLYGLFARTYMSIAFKLRNNDVTLAPLRLSVAQMALLNPAGRKLRGIGNVPGVLSGDQPAALASTGGSASAGNKRKITEDSESTSKKQKVQK